MLKPLWPQFAQGNQSRLAQYRVNETLYTSHALGYSQTCTGKSCFQCSRLPQRTMSPVTCERMHGARDMNTLWCGIRRATIFGAKTRASIGINKFTSSARGCHAIGRAISATLTANLVPTQAASHGIEKTAPPPFPRSNFAGQKSDQLEAETCLYEQCAPTHGPSTR